MGIGLYRHYVTLEHPAVVLVPPDWHCLIQSAATAVSDGLAPFFVRGRFHPGITLETQINFEGRTLQVQGISDVDERHVELVLTCVEVVGRGTTPVVSGPPVELTYQEQVVADGAVAYWPLDDPSGTTARDLAGTRPGTMSGGVLLNQPGIGTSMAMDFDGTTGGIVAAGLPPMNMVTGFTYEAWVNQRNMADFDYATIFERGFNPATTGGQVFEFVRLGTPPVLTLRSNNGGTQQGTQLAGTLAWHHVVVTYDTTTVALYLDGTLDMQAASNQGAELGVIPMAIGKETAGGKYFNGLMQDVAVYARPLTATEIADHHALRLGRRRVVHGR